MLPSGMKRVYYLVNQCRHYDYIKCQLHLDDHREQPAIEENCLSYSLPQQRHPVTKVIRQILNGPYRQL